MALRLYRTLVWLATPLIVARLWWRGRTEPAYRRRIGERFGAVQLADARQVIWFHAVSAGEVIAAAPLIRRIAERYPSRQVLVTTMTPTGADQVAQLLGDTAIHRYAPYDMTFSVARFLRAVRPSVLVLMETELWPNLIHLTAQQQIPIHLINARLSARSARRYQRFAGLSKPMLAELTHISCQYPDHAQRFRDLGVLPQRLSVAGSLKFDRTIPHDLRPQSNALVRCCQLQDRLIWLAASTHGGEESQILQGFERLRQKLPQLQLILAPRHTHRALELERLTSSLGYTSARLSVAANVPLDRPVDVVIVDQMGVLLPLYDLADVAFVGGSLIEFGGQNPIEPALVSTPVVSGRHCFNFTEIVAQLTTAGAMYQVATVDELAAITYKLLSEPELRRSCGAAGYAVAKANRGASERVAQQLIEFIGDAAQ